MCSCPKVHFYEVEFKLAGMRVVPTHKNCGDPISEQQSSKFHKERNSVLGFWGKKCLNSKCSTGRRKLVDTRDGLNSSERTQTRTSTL